MLIPILYGLVFVIFVIAFAWEAPRSKHYSEDNQAPIVGVVIIFASFWPIMLPLMGIVWIMDKSEAREMTQKEKGK